MGRRTHPEYRNSCLQTIDRRTGKGEQVFAAKVVGKPWQPLTFGAWRIEGLTKASVDTPPVVDLAAWQSRGHTLAARMCA